MESVFFTKPSLVEDLYEVMMKVVSDYETACEIGKNGRQVAENIFSAELQGRRLNDFLKGLFV